MKKLFILSMLAAILAVAVSPAIAADPAPPAPTVAASDNFNIDIFGSYRPNNGAYGEGVGVSYFVNRVIGVGVEAQFDGIEGSFPNDVHLGANLILRSPWTVLNLRPYVFGGGGRSIGVSDWEVHFGAGTEFRLASHAALFADWRVFADPNDFHFDESLLNRQQIRAGLRFNF